MNLCVLTSPSYEVNIEKGGLQKAGEYFSLQRKVLVLTDDGVPKEYADALLQQCKEGFLFVLPQGEASKSLSSFEKIMSALLEHHFSRKDCIVAVGGGVVGDLAGFVASTYMRGIDFYNMPTTMLSMVDSSIGGKTAVDFGGYKNIIGSFYQPKAVLIDVNVLSTLDRRQYVAGLIEAIKMAATFDADLFSKIEQGAIDVEQIIYASLSIKKRVVEEDTKEAGLRKVLNFGHTLGHAYEATANGALLHGEAVGLGMIPMSEGKARERIRNILQHIGAPLNGHYEETKLLAALSHDKKGNDGAIDAILVREIGSYSIESMNAKALLKRAKEAFQ